MLTINRLDIADARILIEGAAEKARPRYPRPRGFDDIQNQRVL